MSRRLRIAVVAAQCGGRGSVAAVALRQARELGRRHEVIVLSDSLPAAMPPGADGLQLRPWSFGWLRRFAHVPREAAFCLAVRSVLSSLRKGRELDLVVTHSHAVCAWGALPCRRAGRPKVALVTHGDIRFRPPGTYDARLSAFYRAATGPAYLGADVVVAISPVMAERAIDGGAAAARVVVVPNGLDLEEIGLHGPIALEGERAEEPGEAARRGPIRVLFVGRLAVEKGISTLVEAVRLLAARGANFRLAVVGQGSLRSDLLRAAADPSTGGLIEVLGSVERCHLANHYRSADVLCVPSLDEAMGLVVLEALCCGTPVVGARVGGIPSLVRDGENGLLFAAGDATALAAALARLAADRGELARIQTNARSEATEVAERFSWKARGDSLSSALEAACS